MNQRSFRFQYPPLLLFSLFAVLVFSVLHSFYTYQTLQELALEGRVRADTWNLVMAMFTLTAALALFITISYFLRSRMVIIITDHFVEVAAMLQPRMRLSFDEIQAIVAARNIRGSWTLTIETSDKNYRFPLAHAKEADAPRAPASRQVEIYKHPLYLALDEQLGTKVRVD